MILAPWNEDTIALSLSKFYPGPKSIDEITSKHGKNDIAQKMKMTIMSTVDDTQTTPKSNQKPLWCYFHGITCNSNSTDINFGTVDTIVLDDLGLTGKFPSFMSSFAHMTSLSMKNNKLTDSIPSSIGAMSSLTLLRLSQNQLTGTIPQSMMSLLSLAHLDLSTNFLSGLVPSMNHEGHLKYVNVGTNLLVHYSHEQFSQQMTLIDDTIKPVHQKSLESTEHYSLKTVSDSIPRSIVIGPSK